MAREGGFLTRALVLHLAVERDTVFGGVPIHTTGTLCGRSNKRSEDVTNSTEDRAEVTCQHCAAILANPKHWRFRRYLKQEIPAPEIKVKVNSTGDGVDIDIKEYL